MNPTERIPEAIATLAAVVVVGGLSLPYAAAEPAASGAKMVIVNNDGFTSFYNGDFRTKKDLQRFVHQFQGTDVTAVEWCLGTGGVFNFETRVGDVLGRGLSEEVLQAMRRGDRLACETVQRLIAEGNEPLRVVAQQGKADGIAVVASLRVDAFYCPPMAAMANGRFWHANPDKRIVGEQLGDRMTGIGLSYAYPEVRDFFLNIISEAVERDVAGVNLDFERRPPYFGIESPLVESFRRKFSVDPPGPNPEAWWRHRAQSMNDFVRQLRARLDQAEIRLGHPIQVSVKVGGDGGCTGQGRHLRYGLEIETWVKQGWVGVLILYQSPGQSKCDLAPWRRIVAGTRCKIVCGTDAITKGHDLSPEEDRALARGEKLALEHASHGTIDYCRLALRWYSDGADGFHLFNGWGGPDTLRVLGSLEKVKSYLAPKGQRR